MTVHGILTETAALFAAVATATVVVAGLAVLGVWVTGGGL